MIRESLAPNSRDAFASLSAGAGYAFVRRIDPAGVSQSTSGSAGAAPGWVRLVRTGTRFDAYRSADGSTWTLIGSDAVPMVDNVYVGIATTSRNTTTATDAVLDNFKLTQGASNQPPIVSITSPTDGSISTAGKNIVVTAAANDSDGTVSRVDFFAGSTPLGSVAAAPYTVTWSAVPAGTYSLTAVAVDNDGASTTSAAVSVRVDPAANQPPTVTLTAPANGATSVAPATVTLSATASDPDGTISKVEFYNGTTVLNTDTVAPYSFTWSSVGAGTYSIWAKAYDNAGASASSPTATITVTGGGGTPSGLVGAYSLNEGTGTVAGNTSGSGPSGTITNATWTTGKFGQALSFSGNGEVNLGDVDFTGAFTVEGWFQTRSLYSGGCGSFVMKVHDFGFEVCGGQLSGEVGANGAWTGRATTTLTTTDLNTWKHAAMTYDGTAVRLYINGALISTANGAHTSMNSPLEFGRWSIGGEYWNGLIDEVRLYSRALTLAEIQTDMNTPIGAASGNRPPTATLTSPANAATFTAPATVSLAATASDSDGTIAKVEFYNGTTLLGTATTAPYSFTWSSVAAGTYTLKAMAYDNTGASTSSASITITVSQATSTAPTGVVFTASPDHVALVTSYELRIYAAGANPSTATPIATSNLNKPTPNASNDITVDLPSFFVSLAPGNYVAAVAALGTGGSSVSTGVAFSR
jgi:hypothetical protein